MAVMHHPMKFGAHIFIQSGIIDIFSKIKDGGGPPSWIWLGEPSSMGSPTKPHSWCVPPVITSLSCTVSVKKWKILIENRDFLLRPST